MGKNSKRNKICECSYGQKYNVKYKNCCENRVFNGINDNMTNDVEHDLNELWNYYVNDIPIRITNYEDLNDFFAKEIELKNHEDYTNHLRAFDYLKNRKTINHNFVTHIFSRIYERRACKLPNYFYNYSPINVRYLIQSLKETTLHFSYFKDLNDPYEGVNPFNLGNSSKEYLEEIMKSIFRDAKHLNYYDFETKRKELADISKKIINSKVIKCFSSKNNSNPMWAHYSDNHKGICFKFNPNFDPVLFTNIMPISYSDKNVPDEFKTINDFILTQFYLKSKDWQYENEFRIVKQGYKQDFVFQKQALTAIIFGLRTPIEDIEFVIECLRIYNYPHVELKCAKKISNKFELEIKDLSYHDNEEVQKMAEEWKNTKKGCLQ